MATDIRDNRGNIEDISIVTTSKHVPETIRAETDGYNGNEEHYLGRKCFQYRPSIEDNRQRQNPRVPFRKLHTKIRIQETTRPSSFLVWKTLLCASYNNF
jgi:hypothetical protein